MNIFIVKKVEIVFIIIYRFLEVLSLISDKMDDISSESS